MKKEITSKLNSPITIRCNICYGEFEVSGNFTHACSSVKPTFSVVDNTQIEDILRMLDEFGKRIDRIKNKTEMLNF